MQCQYIKLPTPLRNDLNEQVASSGAASADQSPSCCWEFSDVFVTHLMAHLVRGPGSCDQCVCQADSEVVQAFCSGARCQNNTSFLVGTVFFCKRHNHHCVP